MRRSALLVALAGFALTACEAPPTAPTPASAPVDMVFQSSLASPFQRPAATFAAPAGVTVGELAMNAVDRAINPSDYACSTTIIDDYFNAALDEIFEQDINAYIELFFFGDYILPLYESVYMELPEPHVYGYDGDFNNILSRTDRFARRFWDIDSDHIELVAMKGTMLADPVRLAAMYEFFYGYPPDFAADLAEYVSGLVQVSPVLNGGNHALLSFNAVAVNYTDGTGRIAMGDGIMEAYRELGYGDVVAQAIYGHEFAHHIQFQNGYFDDVVGDGTAAEQTRYTELMADAMGAYFMTHKRGMTMNKHRVAEFLEVYYGIGDCSFTSSGHHGTPNQRMRAAQFGFDVADAAQKKGHIMSSQEFYELFVAEYPNIIAPDA